ncbi:MAG: TlpA family protein disulfide reductase [Mucilaginibacter sp.]|nr:TlpA family protein disulfide reductase [Mucilaginibacter sp.]
MLRIILIAFFSAYFSCKTFAQNKFHVTINLDRGINPVNVRYQYYDGQRLVFLPDTFENEHTAIITGSYYSPKVSFNITYTDSLKLVYQNDFFIDKKPATITFLHKPNDGNRFNYTYINNATPIYDTLQNKSWARLYKFLTGSVMTAENKAFDAFMLNNRSFAANDSLRLVFNKFYKSRMRHVMSFLRLYPKDYFSYWYFINQVDQSDGVLRADTAFLIEQLNYVRNIFPHEFNTSLEGQALIQKLKTRIRPLMTLNMPAPRFTLKTINAQPVDIAKLKGKHILLDFWATWCPPCMAQIPILKKVKTSVSADKLQIIGVSADNDPKALNRVVGENDMNWLHIFDSNRDISELYQIEVFPSLVLIDREGKIIYRSAGQINDVDELIKKLNSLN